MGIMTTHTGLFGSGINRITGDTAIRRGKMVVPNYIRGLSGFSCRIGGAMERYLAAIQQITVSGACRIKGGGKKNLMTGGTEIKLPGILNHGLTVFHCSGCRSAQATVMAVVAGPALNGGAFWQLGNPGKKSN